MLLAGSATEDRTDERNRALELVAVLSLLVATAGCEADVDDGSATGAAPPGVENLTVRVARRSFRSAVAAIGVVKAQVGAEVRVGARISGRVERLHANIRDQVRKGQVLAELDKAELESAVVHRRAETQMVTAKLAALAKLFPSEVERAQAEVDQSSASVTLAVIEHQRHQSLLRNNLIPQRLADEAQEKLSIAQAQLAIARTTLASLHLRHEAQGRELRAALDASKALLTTSQVQLSYATITAPISGVIGSVSTQEGETVAAGLSAPTFVTIIDLNRLMVEAYVDEVDIGKVQLNQRTAFVVDAFPALDFEGRVAAIYPKATIQDNVVKYIVAVDVTTPYEGRLRPEMTATIAIHLEPRTVLAVPSRTVRRESGGTFVYVSKDGRAERRDVKLGWRDGQWSEIAGGLKEREQVFLTLPIPAE